MHGIWILAFIRIYPRPMRKAVRYMGRVQGVGFRATTRSLAAGLAVTGWVRNEIDGSVRLEAQGSGSEIQALLDRVQTQLGRYIRSIEISELADVQGEASFVIAR